MKSWALILDDSVYSQQEGLVPDIDNFTFEVENIPVPMDTGTYRFTIELIDIINLKSSFDFDIEVIPAQVVNPPVLNFIASDSTVSGDVTLELDSTFNLFITATAGSNDMQKWEILRDGITLSGYSGLVPNVNSFNLLFRDIPTPPVVGTYLFTFRVTDIQGLSTELNWNITITNTLSFTTFNDKRLGAQASPNFGSFFKVSDGTVLLFSAANASNGQDVDFFFFNGATNGPTFFSPTDPDAGSLFGGAIGMWSTMNDTKISYTSLDFNSATPLDIMNESVSGTKANQLTLGDVIIFQTDEGLKGILEITALDPGDSGSITFDVKIVN
jgi:hypothetical protein